MSRVVAEVVLEDRRWRAVKNVRKLAATAAGAALSASEARLKAGAALSILLAGDARIAELNQRWRGRPGPTNVLSFPAVEPSRLAQSPVLGDIAMAFETCRREAEEAEKPLGDHFVHLVVHGALHLVGYDHDTNDQAERMEALERKILEGLGVPDPYAERVLP